MRTIREPSRELGVREFDAVLAGGGTAGVMAAGNDLPQPTLRDMNACRRVAAGGSAGGRSFSAVEWRRPVVLGGSF
jgi:ribulose 1,5-bisphosphate synthetase/thiazole synthase